MRRKGPSKRVNSEDERHGTFLLRMAVGALRNSRFGGPTSRLASQRQCILGNLKKKKNSDF